MKLADFGSCKGIFSDQPYTEYISTRWYRSPECLLTDGYYGLKVVVYLLDGFVGGGVCVVRDHKSVPRLPWKRRTRLDQADPQYTGDPFGGASEPFQTVFKIEIRHATHMEFNFPKKMGTGIKNLIPHATPECVDLIEQLLKYDPEERISASDALKHAYFRDLWEMDL